MQIKTAFNSAVQKVGEFGPALTSLLGGWIAADGMALNRPDIAIGGACILVIGLTLLDMKTTQKIPDNIRNYLLTGLGLTTSASLGGGEAISMWNNGALDNAFAIINDPQWWHDNGASTIKVLANAGPYILGSLIDIPGFQELLKKSLGYNDKQIRQLQTGSFMAGATGIGIFGTMVGAGSAIAFGFSNALANTISLYSSTQNNDMEAPQKTPELE